MQLKSINQPKWELSISGFVPDKAQRSKWELAIIGVMFSEQTIVRFSVGVHIFGLVPNYTLKIIQSINQDKILYNNDKYE